MRVKKHLPWLAVSVLFLIGLVVSVAPAQEKAGGRSSTSEWDFDGRTHFSWSDDKRNLEVWAQGRIRFKPDFKDVVSISDDGHLKIRERRGLKWFSVKIVPGDDGDLEYRYYVSGFPGHFDEDARAWMEEVLPNLVEEAGLGAESRAREILNQEGVDAVLETAAGIESDWVKTMYYKILVEEAVLTSQELDSLLQQLHRDLDSDYYKQVVLKLVLERQVDQDVAGDAFLRAVRSLDSDYYKGQVLLQVAGETQVPIDDMKTFLLVLSTVDSDYHRLQVLNRLVEKRDLNAEDLAWVIDSVAGLDSSYHIVQFLLALTPDLPDDAETRMVFFRTVEQVDSDYHRQQILQRLMSDGLEDPATLSFVLQAIADLDSDYHKAQLLTALAGDIPAADGELLSFLEAVETCDSEYHLSQILQQLLQRHDLSEPVLREMLAVVKANIQSTHNRGVLVETIADRLITQS